MASCPYCLEEIKPGARRCPHCQTKLDPAEENDGNVTYVLDKGIVRFGKFVAAIFGIFLIVGVYVYGLDIKDAVKKTSEAEIEVKRGLLSIEQQKSAVEAKIGEINKAIERIAVLEKEIVAHRDETRKTADEVRNLIGDIRSQRETAMQLVLEIRQRTLSPAEEKEATTKREERGIQAGRGSLWNVGSTLHFRFLDGQDKQKNIVRGAIAEWLAQISVTIKETDSDKAEIRISFKQPGSWSYVGTDALGVSQDQPTINYGTLDQIDDEAAAQQVALHEFGHALGLLHEFQNPSAGDVFNVQATYQYYNGLKFSKEVTDATVLSKATNYPGQRPYDRYSVMNYAMPANLFKTSDKQPKPGAHLSESDKAYISSLYSRK